jgi:poly-gamma-glutamate capsule biosynthesis protein CapA/YwtB (metallophosphatase superfamily)
LRGLELYKGKPIFYSLGNFFGQNELVAAGRTRVIAKAGRVSPGPTKGARS